MYRAVDSCLMFLPMLHGKQLVTVENLKDPSSALHPVQQAMVDLHGSQCGFCTPGIVMSLFALSQNSRHPTPEEARIALAGNLCRCTGYRPIIDAAVRAGSVAGEDYFAAEESRTVNLLKSIPRGSISIVTRTQRYDQPTTVRECLELARRFPKAVVVNGATDVALRVSKKFEILPHVIDVSRVSVLTKAAKGRSQLTIGAGVKINDLMRLVRQEFPALHEMLGLFGAEQIRNVATLGGNIGTASPISDILPALFAYKARVVLESPKGRRYVNADKFVTGYRRTGRKPNEIITAIVLPVPPRNSRIRAYKVSRRRDLDIATVSAAFRLDTDSEGIITDTTLAYGGMADHTKRARRAEDFLRGKVWTRATVEAAQASIDEDFAPISDVRGSARFRRIVARNLLLKFWNDTQ
jgi:xanthine dehydrogenase small subunit